VIPFRFNLVMPSNAREVSSRWTPALSKEGWTPISDFFLDNYCKLSPAIKGPEVLLIIHLMRHKWDENAPFPAFKTLAKRMGISPAAVRNHARSLEAKGYLVRQKQVGSTNRFELMPLFTALETLQLQSTEKRNRTVSNAAER
jgi:hypothetical protein